MKFIEPYIHDVCKPEAHVQNKGQSALDSCSPQIVDQAEHNSKDSGSEDFEGMVLHDSSFVYACKLPNLLLSCLYESRFRFWYLQPPAIQ